MTARSPSPFLFFVIAFIAIPFSLASLDLTPHARCVSIRRVGTDTRAPVGPHAIQRPKPAPATPARRTVGRVDPVADGVSQQVEDHHGDEDGDAWGKNRPRRGLQQVAVATHHRAPLGQGRLRT